MFKAFNLLATASLAATLLVSGVAQAQTFEAHGQGPSQVTVRYADLDISREAGAAVLLRRISVAADRVCGGAPDGRSLSASQAYARCHKASLERAVMKVGAPALVAQAGISPVVLATR